MFGLFFLPVPIPTPPPSFQVIKTKNKNEPPFTPFRFPSPPLSQYDECPNIAGTTRSKTDPACPQGTYIPEGKTLTKLITDYSCDKLSSVMHFCSFYGGDGGPGWGRFLGGGRGRRLQSSGNAGFSARFFWSLPCGSMPHAPRDSCQVSVWVHPPSCEWQTSAPAPGK